MILYKIHRRQANVIIAALHNRVGCLKILLQRDAWLLRERDFREKTAFLLAAQKGQVKILQALKELGQDFNETTLDSKYSALHLAVDRGLQPDVVRFLLANGTKKGMKTKNGETAKAIAERQQKPEIVALL
jgi:ankyrin repeat protein